MDPLQQPTPASPPPQQPGAYPQQPGLTPLSTPQAVVAPPSPQPAPQKESSGPGIIRTIVGGLFSWIIIPLGLVIFLHLFVFQAFHVVGSSMFSTLHDADYLVISKVGHSQANIQHKKYFPSRAQIIVFHYPKDESKIFIKRVVGLPGDRVVVKGGQVRVYNPEHTQGYDPDTSYEAPSTFTMIETDVIVPPDNLFVLGDNRAPGASSDSRDWGFLPSDEIIGNAVLRLIPLDKIRLF